MNRMTKMASTTEIMGPRAKCATDPRTERLAGTGWLTGATLIAEGVSCWSISYVISNWIYSTIFTPGGLRSKGGPVAGGWWLVLCGWYSSRLKENDNV